MRKSKPVLHSTIHAARLLLHCCGTGFLPFKKLNILLSQVVLSGAVFNFSVLNGN